MEESTNLQLQRCSHCQRNFKVESLPKHESICQKVSQKKRPVFNSHNQRKVPLPEDYRGPANPVKPPSRKITPARSSVPKPDTFTINGSEYQRWPKPRKEEEKVNKWRDQVESEFERRDQTKKQRIRRVPSKARSLDDATLTGVKKPMHRDRRTMVECPHCLRTFQENSAPRHIQFCEELHNRMPVYKDNWDAKWKLAMRTQYQPPSPKQKSLPPTPPGRLTPLVPRHRSRPKAPVVEEGISSSIPVDDMNYHHDPHFAGGRRFQMRENTMVPSLYNTQIDVADTFTQSAHHKKPRSKMVTYGAVQPFSGPVLGKDALTNRKTRFNTGQNQSALTSSQVYPDQSPYVLDSSVQADLAVSPYIDTTSVKLQTDSPRSDHDNNPTNQLAVPKLQLSTPVYTTPYWGTGSALYATPSPWQTYRGGPLPLQMAPNENAYLQTAPRLMWPSQGGHLPDVIPQPSPTSRYLDYQPVPPTQDLHYRPAPLSAYYSPDSHRHQYQYYTNPYQPRPRYHDTPKPSNQYRNLLTRDNTLLDDDHLFSPGGPLHHHHHSHQNNHHPHKFCANCGSKFHTAASRFCPDCGAINDNNQL